MGSLETILSSQPAPEPESAVNLGQPNQKQSSVVSQPPGSDDVDPSGEVGRVNIPGIGESAFNVATRVSKAI